MSAVMSAYIGFSFTIFSFTPSYLLSNFYSTCSSLLSYILFTSIFLSFGIIFITKNQVAQRPDVILEWYGRRGRLSSGWYVSSGRQSVTRAVLVPNA